MAPGPVEDTLSFLLAQVGRAHKINAAEMLARLGLYLGQELVLFRLFAADGCTQSELVEWLQIEPPTVSKMLQRMEQTGFVERRRDPQDSRVSRVYLTEQGRGVQAELDRYWAELEERTVAGLTLEERILLRRLLLHVRTNLS